MSSFRTLSHFTIPSPPPKDITNADNEPAAAPRGKKASLPPLRSSSSFQDDTRGQDTDRSEASANGFGIAPEPSARAMSVNTNSYQHSGQVDDIDSRDSADVLCATAHVNEMYAYFREIEHLKSAKPTYMANQPHINSKMRSILVDWLVEVHLKFKLVPETLYLTVNIIDRYLTVSKTTRPKLQLIGVTALLIASKYEEIYPPELRDLVYICDRAYSKQEILQTEEQILKVLEYRITIPSAHAFLVRFLKAAHADKKMVQVSCYILDNTLQSYDLLRFKPSELAGAAVYLARKAAGRNAWSPTLLKYAGYCEEEIEPVAKEVVRERDFQSKDLKAVNKKYSSSRYGGVAAGGAGGFNWEI